VSYRAPSIFLSARSLASFFAPLIAACPCAKESGVQYWLNLEEGKLGGL
jgi:hypothetical protein